MRSPSEDRTSRARIRDEALRLYADRGPDAVTVRDVAAAAGVSAALVIRHYGSKERLREAVDEHVIAVFEELLKRATAPDGADPFAATAVPSMAELVTTYLPTGSAIPGYLGQMLLAAGPAGSRLFSRLFSVAQDALAALDRAGLADAGSDPAIRAAFLLVNDLSVLILRPHLDAVLGVDLLSAAGMRRWSTELMNIYRNGLGGSPATDRAQ